MIYLQNNKEIQALRIPRSLPTPADASLYFIVRNTITHQEEGVQVTDESPSSQYYLFNLQFGNDWVDSGEYEYRVMAGETILAQGIMRVLDTEDTAPVEVEQYNATIDIEQYGRTE